MLQDVDGVIDVLKMSWICKELTADIRIRIPAIVIRITRLRPAIRPIIPIAARKKCIGNSSNL
jgi:hypothetical protein